MTKYKVDILMFEGEGETLKAQSLYTQTVETLNIRKVIEAVNADAPLTILPLIRKRAPRSDRGKPHRLANEIANEAMRKHEKDSIT